MTRTDRTKKKAKSPFPERFTARQWQSYITKGRDLVEQETQIQFALGDLTLKMIPKQDAGGNHGVGIVLERFADEIGIPLSTLTGYRHEAIAWPKASRARGVPFSVHRALDACDDRFKVVHHPPEGKDRWTLNEALRYAGRTPQTPEEPEEKLDRVRTLLEDSKVAARAVTDLVKHRPEVAEKVMTNKESRSALFRANMQRLSPPTKPSTGGRGASRPTPPEETLVDDTAASRQVLELLGLGTAFYTGMQELIPNLRVAEFPARAKKTINENHRRVRAVLDWCDTVIETGDTSMDEQIARLLEGK